MADRTPREASRLTSGNMSPEVHMSSPSPEMEARTTTYAAITSEDAAEEEGPSPNPRAADQTPRRSPNLAAINSYGSTEPSARQRVASPDQVNRSKRPGMSRRSSSKFPHPHKGEMFSVDDYPSEIEQDFAQRQASLAAVSSVFGTLRRKPSTLRRRGTAQPSPLPRVQSAGEAEEEEEESLPNMPGLEQQADGTGDPGDVGTLLGEGSVRLEEEPDEENREEGPAGDEDEDDEDTSLSDTESFTLKDRQDAINETHPFGIRIWKPALYQKIRSVQKAAEGDIHSSPGGKVSNWLFFFNILWTVFFGWWLALAAVIPAIVCLATAFAPGSLEYGKVLFGLSSYLLFPFGQFVKLQQDEAYAEEDEGEGRSISEYEQWQSGDLEDGRLFFGPVANRSIIGRHRNSIDSASETDSLLGRTRRRGGEPDRAGPRSKRRLFGRGQWNFGRVIFFVFFYGLITPLLFVVSGICWLLVFWIPMARVTLLLFYHLRRHPLALSFHSDSAYSRGPGAPASSILLCTYRAVGLQYWKYTVDGTNIFLINLMGVVLFAIFDYWVLDLALGLKIFLTSPGLLFALSLVSIIPLAYFIGQAVASISAQSSMGVGAAINAFFSTIVEVYLYCVALNEGKGQLVEGSIIGSLFAGILFLPGLSMCFGAIKRKTQRFNAKSAGVTSTMLLFAVIAAFGPTLFYEIYGSHELICSTCVETSAQISGRDCRRCFFSQVPTINDRFYNDAVRPYCWFAAVLLFLSYIIGLWFTLRTHAAVIWATEVDEKKLFQTRGSFGISDGRSGNQNSEAHSSGDAHQRIAIRESQLYKRILGQSLKQFGMVPRNAGNSRVGSITGAPQRPGEIPHMVPPKTSSSDIQIPGFTEEENLNLVREVAEMAATAATVAAKDATRAPRKVSVSANTPSRNTQNRPPTHRTGTVAPDENDDGTTGEAPPDGGSHDAPNWSRTKSAIVLLGATVLYAIIAEILVTTVDVVLTSVKIDEKFLGITLFALVPNTTEFLNAISFAMNGNIALSMEIGSAYALQVCLLQIPALVLFSAIHEQYIDPAELLNHTFTLIFPRWDMATVILCVFLLSYMYGEGKSNYFKGSILLLSYLVVMMGFWFSSQKDLDTTGDSRFDVHGANGYTKYKTVGRGLSGVSWET
ncbi:MAG: hypothetical protein M1829_000559 [Trizodia sp. TS-e1964]|nr:MAG: hypothetical protein M1829_000559 [Trizodia sp. TS-e1964]